MWNRRQRILIGLGFSVVFLAVICMWGSLSTEEARVTDFSRKNIAPCLEYIFGTDWLGRDMLARTLKGLSISILIGILAAVVSAAVALILGIASAAMGKTVDTVISFCIDLIMGIPHMLLLILISVALGKGMKGVVIERRGHRRGPYTLAFPGQTDTGGSDPAQGEPLYPDFLQTGEEQLVYCQETYAASSCASVYRRPGTDVSPCDPS